MQKLSVNDTYFLSWLLVLGITPHLLEKSEGCADGVVPTALRQHPL